MITLEAGGRRVSVPVAAHACQLAATGAESAATARAFLRDGIRGGDRCVALVPGDAMAGLLELLAEDDIDPDEIAATGQLRIETSAPRPRQAFDPYGLVARHLTDVGDPAVRGGRRLRILVDMHWFAPSATAEAVLRYEAACHAAISAHVGRVVVLAQYRYADLAGRAVIGMLHLHPSAVVAQFVRRNPNPADPVAFMARLLHAAPE